MTQTRSEAPGSRRPGQSRAAGAVVRVVLTLLAILVVEVIVVGLALSVPALALAAVLPAIDSPWLRVVAAAFAAAPSYVLFALCLMLLSAASTRLTGARTPPDAQLRLADMSWPLMQWARYLASSHVVRLFAGVLFKGTPMWTWYLRMNGATLGRGVYVNSLSVSDHNLLHFGDQVVIGGEAHVSGHTVEGGYVKTGRVVLGDRVTIGLSTVVEIDVEIGPGAQVGALSFVPKHARLEGGQVYVGIPVRVLERT
jgi:acetyltransferase-like isoleucine patch superfamily enzyme